MKSSLFQSITPKQWKILSIIALLIAIAVSPLFKSLTYGSIGTDIPSHCLYAQIADLDWHSYPANFGLYASVNLLRHCLPEVEYLHGQYYAMIIILSISFGAKWLLSTLMLRQMFIQNKLNIPFSTIILAGVALLFFFAIPYRYFRGETYYYLGSFVPNVWHNSTIIAAMPISLLIFWLSAKELESPDPKRVLWLSVLVFFQVCIKPSYVFIYSAGFPLLFLIRYGFRIKYWVHYLPAALSALFVMMQWWLIYQINNCGWDNGHIIFSVFGYWSSICTISTLPLALVASVAAPLLALFAIEKQKNWTGIYATVVFVFAVIMYLTIAEEGPRFSGGNFFWQIVPATYILFLVALPSLISGLINFQAANRSKKIIVSFTAFLFAAHFISGVIYIIRMVKTSNYF